LSRLDAVETGLRDLEAADPVEALGALLSSRHEGDEHGSVFRREVAEDPWLERFATLATVVYDLAARRMWIRVGADPGAPLVEAPPASA